MLSYFRTRPLLFAASCMAAVLLIAFLALSVFIYVILHPLTPQQVLAEALAMDQDPKASKKLLDAPSRSFRSGTETLRGITRREAEEIRTACRNVDDWSYVGDEVDERDDCPGVECSGTALMMCVTAKGVLIGRLWMERDKVDHIADLALDSEFLACRADLCPDFAVGEPIENGYYRGTAFKTDGRVNKP